MIVVFAPGHTSRDVSRVEKKVRELGYTPYTLRGDTRTTINCIGDESSRQSLDILNSYPGVERLIPIQKKYKLVSREGRPDNTVIRIGRHRIGGGVFHVAAGPCAVESLDQMKATAGNIRGAGATIMRGGAFKPRTSPYSFQGLGQKALDIFREVKQESGLLVVSEVVRESDLPGMVPVVDILQIGARNCLNYSLLEAVAETHKPVLLKRGMAVTVEEWLLAAEYLVKSGNPNVILCERGIRTFETATRNTLDISAVILAKKESNLPVFVDPSHAAGRADLVIPLSCAAAASGADGLIVEVHPNPAAATSDATQQLSFEAFARLMTVIRPYVLAAGLKPAWHGQAKGKVS